MGLAQIGIPGLVLIVLLALIIFGPKKLPEIGKAAGQTMKEFKNTADDLISDEESDRSKEDTETNKHSSTDNR